MEHFSLRALLEEPGRGTPFLGTLQVMKVRL